VSPDASERLTVAEAAGRLGVSQDAVRKRIKRGSIRYERDEDGRVYVYLDASETTQDKTEDASPDTSTEKLIRTQEAEIEFLRRELHNRTEEIRRRDVIISQLTSRIPEIEAPREEAAQAPPQAERGPVVRFGEPRPSEPPGAPESGADEHQGRGPIPEAPSPQESTEPRRAPWWRRVFGG
jgi:excisionase family DNA binding protein